MSNIVYMRFPKTLGTVYLTALALRCPKVSWGQRQDQELNAQAARSTAHPGGQAPSP